MKNIFVIIGFLLLIISGISAFFELFKLIEVHHDVYKVQVLPALTALSMGLWSFWYANKRNEITSDSV